ncbi:MAG: PqqD family protein [Chloroflexi bacterium]|nr:PqqD family protein [Chloroflexota bacterium]
MISLDSTVVAADNQVSTDLADEIAILNLQNGVYYGLTPVGAYVWKLLQQPQAVRGICAAVLVAYDVEPERCERDILELLDDMAAQGLIKVTEP